MSRPTQVFGIDSNQLFRAFVEPPPREIGLRQQPERAVFVEARYRWEATTKIVAAINAIEYRGVTALGTEERIYNLQSAAEMMADSPADSGDERIFECGWRGAETFYVENPLFLIDCPGLIRKWAQIPKRS